MLKSKDITALFTSLSHDHRKDIDVTEDAISSLADNWIKLRNIEYEEGKKRSLVIVKARGMGHSNIFNHYTISNKGIEFLESKPAADSISRKTARK
jgi:circadian clock protein KaiC